MLTGKGLNEGATPVSYTHLDVYKRQLTTVNTLTMSPLYINMFMVSALYVPNTRSSNTYNVEKLLFTHLRRLVTEIQFVKMELYTALPYRMHVTTNSRKQQSNNYQFFLKQHNAILQKIKRGIKMNSRINILEADRVVKSRWFSAPGGLIPWN